MFAKQIEEQKRSNAELKKLTEKDINRPIFHEKINTHLSSLYNTFKLEKKLDINTKTFDIIEDLEDKISFDYIENKSNNKIFKKDLEIALSQLARNCINLEKFKEDEDLIEKISGLIFLIYKNIEDFQFDLPEEINGIKSRIENFKVFKKYNKKNKS
jgi:hypothetical protein